MCQEIIKGKRCKRSKEPYCYAHVKTINSDCKKSNADSNINILESAGMGPSIQTATEPLTNVELQDKHGARVVEAEVDAPIYSAAESSGQIAQKKGDSDGTASTINTRQSVSDTMAPQLQDGAKKIKCQWLISTVDACMLDASVGNYCKYCAPKAEAHAKVCKERKERVGSTTNSIQEKQEQHIVLAMQLIKSSFDDTTIIEYFRKFFPNYKSYDGIIYYFNGTYWIKGSNQYIINDIDLMYRTLYELIKKHFQDEDLMKNLKKIVCLRKVNYKEILIKGIIGYITEPNDLWDLNVDLIGFNNGTYDLLRNKFREGRYEDYITMVIDYDYMKSGPNRLQDVDRYFKKIMPVDDERELLLLLLSTMFSGRHLERFIVCTGEGRNGKDTTFTYLMNKVLGPYYYNCSPTAITQTIKGDQNVSVANFDKKRAVVMSEPDDKETIKTSMVKTLTGANETAMRTLYSTKTKVNLNESLFMLCNDKPLLDRSQQAMLDRLIVIPFRCTFKSREYMDENQLVEGENNVFEANDIVKSDSYVEQMKLAIFNYLLPYYRKFRKDGYLIKHIPASIRKLNQSYMEQSDQFMSWFNSEYEKTTQKDDYIKVKDVYTNYCASEFYHNLTKAQKRDNNLTNFREKVSNNLSLRLFYKDKFQPTINGKQIKVLNVLTNYKVRPVEPTDEIDDPSEGDIFNRS